MPRHIHVILAAGAALLLSAGLTTAIAGNGAGPGGGMGPQGAQPATPATPATPAQAPTVDVQQDRLRDQDRDRIHDTDMLKDKTKDKAQDRLRDQDRDRMHDSQGATQRAEMMYSKEQQAYNRQASKADKRIYGWQIMTPAERSAYRAKVRSLRTIQERDRFRTEHHDQMQQRAAQMGIDLQNPPPSGNGAGSGNMRNDQGANQRAEMMYSKEQQEVYNRQASDADKRIYGWQVMSPAERSAYRAKVRSLRTIQERDRFRTEHHALMQERAQQMGISLPAEPQPRNQSGGDQDDGG